MIITIKTDSDIAQVELRQPIGEIVDARNWEAGRKLSSELLATLADLLQANNRDWESLTGVVVFRGPGSFTGLRIGATVANTIAYAQAIPIVGMLGDSWVREGLDALAAGNNDTQVLPHYGAEPNITKPNHRKPPKA